MRITQGSSRTPSPIAMQSLPSISPFVEPPSLLAVVVALGLTAALALATVVGIEHLGV